MPCFSLTQRPVGAFLAAPSMCHLYQLASAPWEREGEGIAREV